MKKPKVCSICGKTAYIIITKDNKRTGYCTEHGKAELHKIK